MVFKVPQSILRGACGVLQSYIAMNLLLAEQRATYGAAY